MTPALPPGPKPQPFFGNLLAFRKDPLAFYTSCAREYGDIALYRIAHVNALLLSHPALIEQVLVTDAANFIKGRVVRANPQLLGNGLLTSEGELWRQQRRLAQPAFHRGRLAAYSEIITTNASQMRASWQEGESRDIHQDMKHLTLAVIARILFGVDVDRQAGEIGGWVQVARDTFSARIQSGLLIPEAFPTPGNLRMRHAFARLNEVVFGIIRQRRLSAIEAGDCLGMLLKAQAADGSRLTDRQLRDEVVTLLIAGHETTTLVLTWAWYLLARHPEAAAQLRAELDQVLGGRLPQADDLPRLPFTQMIVKEVLRLYPPIWATPRQAVRDCEIGGYRVPAGTSLTLSQWVMHRHPLYFDDPEAFRPERWRDDLEKRLPTGVYFPFGAGPRQCLGYWLAMTEATLVLAMIAQTCYFTLAPGTLAEPCPSITLYPRSGLRVQIQRRPA